MVKSWRTEFAHGMGTSLHFVSIRRMASADERNRWMRGISTQLEALHLCPHRLFFLGTQHRSSMYSSLIACRAVFAHSDGAGCFGGTLGNTIEFFKFLDFWQKV